MNIPWVVGLAMGTLALMPAIGGTAEHGGKEHGGKEPARQAVVSQAPVKVEPDAEELRQTIRDYITQTTQKQGAFTIKDPLTKSIRTLILVGVHDRVGKTGNNYYACTDMRDAASGELLDLDFDIEPKAGKLRVVDVRIHKVDGQACDTYDDHGNRVPLKGR